MARPKPKKVSKKIKEVEIIIGDAPTSRLQITPVEFADLNTLKEKINEIITHLNENR